jgi:hypothetical protein
LTKVTRFCSFSAAGILGGENNLKEPDESRFIAPHIKC